MLEKLQKLGHLVGSTPLVPLEHPSIHLYTKLEYHNLMNSVKARTAFYMLSSAIKRGEIHQDTTLIESSSGNLAIALATLCQYLKIKFIPVIDPNINGVYEDLLHSISYKVVKVTDRDATGGFLLTRLNKIQELLYSIPNAYWTNQYQNPDNYYAHYHGIGTELVQHFETLDYAFIGVGTGGTISGISNRLKEAFPNVKVIAVDSEGSVIFNDMPKKRYIPGIGASTVPELVKRAVIDEVVHISEQHTVEGCHQLFENHGIFAGGSSGTSYYAINQYFQDKTFVRKPNVVFLCPDNGVPYVQTVYNAEWIKWLSNQSAFIS
ncbi:cysteine synthase A [Thermoactinomyces sp. DSM 45891]|uniref:2,3-diaminopropionate biosynthesis protein SbnA n=1 Tax=Thermoactinomyces sp. DSM 45891 TaxID=1761907 RepID=UPI000913F3F8|nr:2,3-diaminopropionate biosynthesis protein SbnA [Thermoactinomyces sp. DSM 45891]SFX17583.1 cysteine synthase A [Thermoactinomyces sp. DSM 45891]